jgi:hypothetical protein
MRAFMATFRSTIRRTSDSTTLALAFDDGPNPAVSRSYSIC